MRALTAANMAPLHIKYLRARLAQMQSSNQGAEEGKGDDIHRWYEMEMRSKDVPDTAETIACMLKASLLTATGKRLERLVHRYLQRLMQQDGLGSLMMGEILTDQDLVALAPLVKTSEYLIKGDTAMPDADGGSPDAHGESDPDARQVGDVDGAESRNETVAASSDEAQRTPDVLSTPQKGAGLKTIRQSLSLFQDIPEGHDIGKLSFAQRREFQARIEKDCIDAAVRRWREENEVLVHMGHHPILTSISHSTLGLSVHAWQTALEARIRAERDLVDRAENIESKSVDDLDRCWYGPFLRLADPKRLAAVTIISALNIFALSGADRGVTVSRIVSQVGKLAELDIELGQKQEDDKRRKKHKGTRSIRVVLREVAKKRAREEAEAQAQAAQVKKRPGPRPGLKAAREAEAKAAQEAKAEAAHEAAEQPSCMSPATAQQNWPLTLKVKVGAFLVSALTETAMISSTKTHPESGKPMKMDLPAFHHTHLLRKGKKMGMLRANRALVEIMKREPRGDFLARYLPMVAEPEPWTRCNKGGFLEIPFSVVRIKAGELDQKIYTDAAVERGHMDQVFKGLDVLGKTAWRINRPVFDVMLQCWNSKEAIANIPALHPQVEMPRQPEHATRLEKAAWGQKMRAVINEMGGLHSTRCFMNYQFEVARAFRDQTFYLPHNIDFRGRAYPMPPYLNHMGADHVRGLLRFAKGRALGETGMRWLKVHLANVYGYDKASLRDREEFASKHLDQIRDSCERPLDGQRWWLQAEDPWQCLATCFELKAALESPDPRQFVSHLPVHQDGTCNGLQHYAALGGDTWGAQQVNLEPGERPADVYSAVANLVNEEVAKDVARHDPLAMAVQGKVTRKVVKQTVMTNVYGVTYIGAKAQVLKQLRSLYPELEPTTGQSCSVLAGYVTTKVFAALSSMFRGAHEIQHWLGEVGGRVCRGLSPEQVQIIASMDEGPAGGGEKAKTKAYNKTYSKGNVSAFEMLSQFRATIIWTTPLRMPVVQPYRKPHGRKVYTCLQELQLSEPDKFDPINRRKQLQAFPPNFIHSLDASHMLLTALECDARGLTFAAVHDSFWTHAGDIDTMNDLIRDSFIRIHSEDVIGRLAAEFQARYGDFIVKKKIDTRTPLAKRIAAHRRVHRLSMTKELLQEQRRAELLRSDDPAKVAEGRAMVTPGSICEEMADQDATASLDLADKSDALAVSTLGSIPVHVGRDAGAVADDEEADPEPEDISAEDEAEDEAEDDDMMTAAAQDGAEDADVAAALADEEETDTEVACPGGDDDDEEKAAEGEQVKHGPFAFSGKRSKPVRKRTIHYTEAWVPFRLPPMPTKGDFDVKRLRESKYFFS